MRDKLRMIFGVAPVEASDDNIQDHDKAVLFNLGGLYVLSKMLIYYFANIPLEQMTFELSALTVIVILMTALKFGKRFFWFEMLVMTIFLSGLNDMMQSTSPLQPSLFMSLVILVLVYYITDFVRLLIPLMLFDIALIGSLIVMKSSYGSYTIGILLILLLTVIATLFGRDRYNAFKANKRLTEQHSKLLQELKSVNYHLNSELLQQSVHLMNLEAAEEKFRVATNAIDAVILLVDEEEQVVYSNEWLSMRYDMDQSSFNTLRDFRKIVSEEDYERIKAAFRATQKTEEDVTIREIPVVVKSDQKIWVNFKFTSVGTSGILVTGFDVTERKLNEERVERLSAIKDMLLRLNPMILRDMDVKDLLDFIIDHLLIYVSHADLACIMRLDQGVLRVVACKGYDFGKAGAYSLEYKHSFVYKATQGRFVEPIIINNIQQRFTDGYDAVLENEEKQLVESSLCTPIILDGSLYGMINIDAFKSEVFTASDIEMMTFLAEQLALALKYQSLLQAES